MLKAFPGFRIAGFRIGENTSIWEEKHTHTHFEGETLIWEGKTPICEEKRTFWGRNEIEA